MVKVLFEFPGLWAAWGKAGPAVRWPLLRPRPVPPVAVGPLSLSFARCDWTRSAELQ